jgi:hypothetical protein
MKAFAAFLVIVPLIRYSLSSSNDLPTKTNISLSALPLNPQPLPPGIVKDTHVITRDALNPQPLPPIVQDDHLHEREALNPQPLPPGIVEDDRVHERDALNPQPLPPGIIKDPHDLE